MKILQNLSLRTVLINLALNAPVFAYIGYEIYLLYFSGEWLDFYNEQYPFIFLIFLFFYLFFILILFFKFLLKKQMNYKLLAPLILSLFYFFSHVTDEEYYRNHCDYRDMSDDGLGYMMRNCEFFNEGQTK